MEISYDAVSMFQMHVSLAGPRKSNEPSRPSTFPRYPGNSRELRAAASASRAPDETRDARVNSRVTC